MSQKKIIAIAGATGGQGGGLARAILSDASSPFAVRALARDPNSTAARELAAAGAEVVAADLDDRSSIARAFEGAYGAYCVTFFWAHFSPEKEVLHARTMAECAKDAGMQHVIWSTLEDTRKFMALDDDRMPTLMGKYKVPHFDAKGEADDIFRSLGLPVTFLLTSFYWDNFIHFGMGPQPGADGIPTISLPLGDRKLPGIAVEDIGRCAYGIFQRNGELIGKTVGVAGEHLTGTEIAATFARVLGTEVRYNAVPHAVYRTLGFPGADDLGNMFQFKHDFEEIFVGARDLNLSRSLNPSLQTFEQWLRAHRDSFTSAGAAA